MFLGVASIIADNRECHTPHSLLCARKLVEKSIVELRKLWASKSLHIRTKLIESPAKDGADRTKHGSSSTIADQSVVPVACV